MTVFTHWGPRGRNELWAPTSMRSFVPYRKKIHFQFEEGKPVLPWNSIFSINKICQTSHWIRFKCFLLLPDKNFVQTKSCLKVIQLFKWIHVRSFERRITLQCNCLQLTDMWHLWGAASRQSFSGVSWPFLSSFFFPRKLNCIPPDFIMQRFMASW